MKKLIIKSLIFSLPVLAILIVVEILLRTIPNDYKNKKQYLDENATKIETLIMGSSHSLYDINPDFMNKCTFNASHVSQSLDLDFAIFDKYKNNFTNLKTIVIPISYFTLWGKLEDGPENWRVKNYVIYYDIDKASSVSDYSEVLNNEMRRNIKRLIKYYLHSEDSTPCTELGWGTSFNSKNAQNLQETGKTAAKRHTIDDISSEQGKKILIENIEILNNFYIFCQKHNVKLVLITTPTYFTYRENLNIEQKDAMFETINTFINQHNNASFINYFEDIDFVAQDFFDADHLNEIGAEKLSKKIQCDIDSLECDIK